MEKKNYRQKEQVRLDERNQRIFNVVRNRVRYLFKDTLTAVETESKKFGVDSKFFDNSDVNKKGFYAIRKTLFTHGNDIIDLLELLLSKIDITPKGSVVEYSKEVEDQISKESKSKKWLDYNQ